MKHTNNFNHWWIDFLATVVLLLFIFIFDYEQIIELRLTPGRTPQGSGISGILRSIDLLGGKFLVYGILWLVAILFFSKGLRKFLREWGEDEPQSDETISISQLSNAYQTLCDVMLAKGYDDAYDDFIGLIAERGTTIWASKVADKLNRLKNSNPDAYKTIEKWAKLFEEFD
ncbi:hypothetical protein [Natronoflexus pectinivorans]|uniref:Uncharacterized protein n=1 Tax=Natronoflexus pectinivorans TaxID=682526 RepID=A0A4R2GJQ0_9BACT|nr:hypothetical protein [Natronoflexus pectinivorans]TCO08787.1 hypothetical protein EV194_10498 [Natronoflexus pectinivorans]